MSASVDDVGVTLSKYLDRIAKHFPPGVKITLVIRNPSAGTEAGCVIGNDGLDEAIGEIQRSRKRANPIAFTADGFVSGKGGVS